MPHLRAEQYAPVEVSTNRGQHQLLRRTSAFRRLSRGHVDATQCVVRAVSNLALTALLHAVVEAHAEPRVVRDRFLELSEQATAIVLPTSSDDQTRPAEIAMGAMKEWLNDLAAARRT